MHDTTACLVCHLYVSAGECVEGAVTPCGASHIRFEIVFI